MAVVGYPRASWRPRNRPFDRVLGPNHLGLCLAVVDDHDEPKGAVYAWVRPLSTSTASRNRQMRQEQRLAEAEWIDGLAAAWAVMESRRTLLRRVGDVVEWAGRQHVDHVEHGRVWVVRYWSRW